MANRRELTAEEKACAQRANALWQKLKREKKISQQTAAGQIGMTASGLNQYINGVIPLNTDATALLAGLFNVDPREIDPSWLADSIPNTSGNVTTLNIHPRKVPVVSWVVAGKWCESPDNFQPGDADEWITTPFECGDSSFCLLVSGDSMEPDYLDGSYILVDPDIQPLHNDDVVVRTIEGKQNFKRLQITPEGTYLLALNKDEPNRKIKIPEETHICGVVIGTWRKTRRKW